jgi:protein-tyrosine phosphatase
MSYVDIHSHILHGLDDGAKSLEESVQMLEIASRTGTSAIVATPHANTRYPFRPAVIEERLAELRERVDIAVYGGCDFHLQYDNIEDAIAHPRKYTINRQRYLLVEFSDLSVFHAAGEILERLLEAGMVPIITHPERNARLQANLDPIAGWVASGCYVQVTAGSYTGLFGKRARSVAIELFKRGLTHFVASDAHNCQGRTPSLREAYERLSKDWGEETIRPLFVENPLAVLEGNPIDYELPMTQSRGRKWYQFWA